MTSSYSQTHTGAVADPSAPVGTSAVARWHWVQTKILHHPDLTTAEIYVAIVLASHVNDRTQACFPKIETIAHEASLSDRKVRQALKRLVELGLVAKLSRTVGRLRNRNAYQLIGLGDENGLSSILRVAPSNTLSQVDIDNAPRIELAAGYTDIVDMGDIDGDGLDDIGLQSENGVVRLPRSVFENDNAIVRIGSSGEDIFVSSADDEVFVGMAGDDTYSFSGSFGHDVIDNTSSSAFEDDNILFNADISPEQLWFSKSGDDLLIEVLGGDQSINVVDWYEEDTSAKLDHISFADGRDLVSHEVEQLVSIMAGVSRTGDEELVTDALSQAQVEEEVEQLWSA